LSHGIVALAALQIKIRHLLAVLFRRESEYTEYHAMRMFIGSWNVNGKHPDKDMAPWLFGRSAGACAPDDALPSRGGPGGQTAAYSKPPVSPLADIVIIG